MDRLPRHPWLDTLLADPEQAVADLFSGRTDKYPYARLSDAEFLLRVLPSRDGLEQEYDKLEDGLLAWFMARRREDWRARTRLGLPAYVMALIDALSAVQMLELGRVAHALREQHNAYLRWLEPLRLGRAADPALELWRSHALLSDDHRFLPQWMRFCIEADNTRPVTYLTVALQGLRELPNQGDAALNLRYILRGLAERYLANRDSDGTDKEFKSNLAALRGAYLYAPEKWRVWWDDALTGLTRDEADAVRALLDEQPGAKRHEQKKQHTPYSNPSAFPVRAKELAGELKARKAVDELWPKMETLISDTLNHCRNTGDSYYFIRSFCNLGDQVLKRANDKAKYAVLLLRWLPDALQWERDNPHVWMLWAQCLEAAGAEEQAEWVYWEMRRYFPDDEHCRVELARLLMAQERNEEALALLREAAERSPGNAPSRVELARLLMAQEEAHYPEAEQWLREAAVRNPDNEPSRVELARLLMVQERIPEAQGWLAEAAERNPDKGPCHVELARLLSLSGKNQEAIALLDEFDAKYGGDKFVQNSLQHLRSGQSMNLPRLGITDYVQQTRAPVRPSAPVVAITTVPDVYAQAAARATRAAFRMALQNQLAQQGRADLEQALQADPDDLLAAFYLDWEQCLPAGYEAPPTYALDAAHAYHCASGGWDELVQRFPEQRRLTWGLRWLAALRDGGELPEEVEKQLAKLQQRQSDEDEVENDSETKRNKPHIQPVHAAGENRVAQLFTSLRDLGTKPVAAWLDRQAQELIALTINRNLDPVAATTY